MSKFVCEDGELTIIGMTIVDLCLSNVTIDISADTVDYQCMGDGSWQSAAAGTRSWEVSFETALDDTTGVDLANTIGETGALTFKTDKDGGAFPQYDGTAIITGISINTPVDDYATVSWTATGTGAIVESFPA